MRISSGLLLYQYRYRETEFISFFIVCILACNRTYDTSNGRILNPSFPYNSYSGTICEFGIQVPNPQGRISIYFKYFYISSRRGNCTDEGYLKVIFT